MRTGSLVPLVVAGFVLVGCPLAGCSGGGSSRSAPPPPALSNPAVSSVAPVSGDVAGSTSIAIQGSGFVMGAAVNVGGNAATGVTVTSATTITATTPSGTAGPANVVVINPDSQTATLTNGFTYTSSGGNQAPTFSSVSPTSGPTAGGTVITVSGSGFYAGVTVMVGGTLATGVTLLSGATLTCTTPAGSAGAANVVVTNADAQSATGTGAFTYVPPPTIGSITPGNGPQSGGITVTIGGTDFVTGATVTFGSTGATVSSLTGTAIEVTLPSSASSGSVTVTVTNPDSQNDTTSFTYDPPPTVSGVSPNNGAQAGGNIVTVGGANFVSGAGLAVTFGGNAASGVTWLNAGQIQCQPPAGTGVVAVAVTNPDGQSGSVAGAYAYNALPTVTSVNANTGPAAGGTTVTVNGTNFINGATITFGGNAATNLAFLGATQYRCDTPAGTGSVAVVLTNPDTQSASLSNAFTYTGSGFAVTSVTPNSGTTAGGTPVTVAGSGFRVGATVDFAGTAATSVVVVDAVTITCVTPSGSAGQVNVTVTNPGPITQTLTNGYTYTAAGTAPTVSNVSPATGPAAGGTVVTVSGSSFATASSPRVTIAGVSATVSAGNSATSITITAPVAPKCFAGGVQGVTVTNPTGDSGTNTSPGWTWTPNLTEPLGVALSTPDVAVDGSGNIHVVFVAPNSSSTSDVIYVRSTDGGRTWTNPVVRITQTSPWSLTPRVSARGSTVAIVWEEQGSPKTIDYVYSTNNGTAFSSIASLPNNGANGFPFSMAPDVDIDANGTVYAAWLELGPTPPPPSLMGPDVRVYSVQGSVTGITSATAGLRSPTGQLIPATAVAADGNGGAVIAWGWTSNGPAIAAPGNVSVAYTTNGGTAWANTGVVTSTPVVGAVSVALLGTNAVVTWARSNGGQWSVNSEYSTNTGTSWITGGAVRAAGTTNSIGSVDVAVDAGGFFTCLYSEAGASQTDVFCSRSSNVGINWSTPMTPSPTGAASTACRVAARALGVVHYAWAEFNASITGDDIVHW